MLSMGKPHPALAITGSIALTLAARTPGTLLGDITGGTAGPTLRLRTPAGVIETWSEERDGSLLVGVDRTAAPSPPPPSTFRGLAPPSTPPCRAIMRRQHHD
jgi:2-methylaconitate cis-trans-isomerase PrpF